MIYHWIHDHFQLLAPTASTHESADITQIHKIEKPLQKLSIEEI